VSNLRSRLDAGERIPVGAALLNEALDGVKIVGIHYKLKELVKSGVLEEREGFAKDSCRYYFKGRPVKVHANYIGNSPWSVGEITNVRFNEPYDVVLDKKTKAVICLAPSGNSYAPSGYDDDQETGPSHTTGMVM